MSFHNVFDIKLLVDSETSKEVLDILEILEYPVILVVVSLLHFLGEVDDSREVVGVAVEPGTAGMGA